MLNPDRTSYLIPFAVAVVATWGLTPLCRRLAVRLRVVALPSERGVHDAPLPYLGGLAILGGFLFSLAVAWGMSDFDTMFTSSAPVAVVVAAVVMCGVGTLDDVREVSAPAKTAGMVLAGSILTILGVSMLYLRIPFYDLLVLSSDWSPLISVLWVIGMANAVNLIDGLDGLAAGIVAIAAGSFFVYAYKLLAAGTITPENPSPLLAVIICGACLGFLPHNFHPAKLMMGDGGALLLGLLMAAATMLVGGQSNDPFSGQAFFFFAPLAIPFFILGVPIVDTVWAILRRARGRTGIASADKGHLHHRLMALGHGQRRSVLILWTWTFLLSGFVLYPVFTGEGDGLVPIGVASLGLLLYTYFHPRVRKARHGERSEPEAIADVSEAGSDSGRDPTPMASRAPPRR